MKTIGVVGCGLMGYGIATNLVRNGYEVKVYDTNPEAVARVVNEGAKAAKTVQELARWSDILILSLPSTTLVEQVLLHAKEGALDNLKSGSVVLDLSTNDVARTRRLAQTARKSGVEYFDCPVSGGPDGARLGTLTIMVGGSKERFPEISPLLQVMGEYVEYMGESGAGQIVKLCNNMIVGGIISLLGEALLTGERAGISKEKMAELFQRGSGQTKVMDVFGPNIIHGTFDNVKFSLANMLKDLQLYRNLAEDEGVPTSISTGALQLFTVSSYIGDAQQDATAVADLLTHQVRT